VNAFEGTKAHARIAAFHIPENFMVMLVALWLSLNSFLLSILASQFGYASLKRQAVL
jgi:hypothetical protein